MKPLFPKQLLHLFARMPEALQCEVLEKAFERYYFLKERDKQAHNRSSLYHKALLFILHAYYDQLKLGSAKKYSRELDSLGTKNKLELQMLEPPKKKGAKKAIRLLNQYAPTIYRLKEKEGRSYAQICQHLAKNHKLKINRTYLCKIYPKIKYTIEDMKAIHFNENTIL